jgi:hypothetical protein
VAKTQLSPDDPVPLYWATLVYKHWVREQMGKRKLTYAALAEKIEKFDKRLTCSDSALVQFLVGKKGEPLRPSVTQYMPAINKIGLRSDGPSSHRASRP